MRSLNNSNVIMGNGNMIIQDGKSKITMGKGGMTIEDGKSKITMGNGGIIGAIGDGSTGIVRQTVSGNASSKKVDWATVLSAILAIPLVWQFVMWCLSFVPSPWRWQIGGWFDSTERHQSWLK